MKQTHRARTIGRSSESGGARLKFIVVVLVLGLLAYCGYVFFPVAYDARYYKDQMQHFVDVASVSGYQPSWVKDQLTKAGSEYNVPADAVITPSVDKGQIIVRVQFTRPVQFPGYTYNYEFDQTVKSTSFLNIK